MTRVTDLLKVGRASAVSAESLMQALNIDRRALYREIRLERLRGAAIVPDYKGGYYLPDMETAEGQQDYEVWRRRMQAIGRGTFAVTKERGNGEKEQECGSAS